MSNSLYNDLYKSVTKVAIGLRLKENGAYHYPLITQNKRIIEYFNPDKKDSILTINEEINTVTAYEITLDKVVTINVQDTDLIHFWGVPYEITPPMYLLPQLSGYITDDQLFDSQIWFFERVKRDRDRGCFAEKSLPEEMWGAVGEVKVYFDSFIDNVTSDQPLISYFKDWPRYGDFNLKRNIKDAYDAVNLYKSMYFIPAIQACIGKELSVEEDLEKFVDKSIFVDLKEKWIAFLNKTKEETLLQKTNELKEYDNLARLKLSKILEHTINDALASAMINQKIASDKFEISQSSWSNFLKTEALKEADNSNYVFSDVLIALDVPRDIITSLLNAMEASTDNRIMEILDPMKIETDEVFFEYRQLQTQYELLLQRLENLHVETNLEDLDDYRLFLRYWPDCFDYKSEFHDNVRPFTDVELYVIKFLITEKIPVDFDIIYRPAYDYYNSIIDILQPYTFDVIEKRAQYINQIAQQRINELKNEMAEVDLSEEEKNQFFEILQEMGDIDKYRNELKQEKDLVNILAYWPVSLYPVPADILQV